VNPIVFALRHPITTMVAIAAVVLGSGLAWSRMKKDIFPPLNLPVVYVAQPYGGMDPGQMEGLITNYYEYHFLYINGIHHVESRNVQGAALMKLYFHPDTDMAQAMAEVVGYVNRSRAFMPPGTVPPFIMRFDTGSVPVGYLVLRSDKLSIGEIQDKALFKVRPMFAALPGVSAPPPFGGNQRTVVVRVDPDKLRACNVSPEEVIKALSSGNTISPSGNIRVKDQMPIVPVDTMVVKPADLGNIPIRPGSDVYLRHLGTIEDSSDIPTGYALVNGQRAVYILVNKRANASTLAVVNEVKKNLPKMQEAIPPEITVSFEFDQSPYVTRAMWGVGIEGALGAALTGLMVLIFLGGDWRSVIVVVLNIPFALLGAIVALWLCDQTINLMTLGGLALAVGILVDESTVEVENIHTQFEHTPNIARAVRAGNAQTAVPRLLAMLCILAVFIPSFFMEGAARNLFVPLALAVGFSMITSYLLSSTFVPVMSVWLLRHYHAPQVSRPGWFSFARLRNNYARGLGGLLALRWLLVPVYLAGACLLVWQGGDQVGREIFPTVDSGQFQVRLRAPTGTRIRVTEQLAVQALEAIKEKVGPDNVAISVGYVGLIPSSYPINTVYLWMSGPEEAVLRVALEPDSEIQVEKLKAELRQELRKVLQDWLRRRLQEEKLPPAVVERRVSDLKLSFEPADIVNEVMSFGSPTPVEVAVSGIAFSGPERAQHLAYVEKVRAELARVPSLRDLQYVQPLDYPAVKVQVDRQLVGASGLTTEEVAHSVVAATSSSRFVVPNYWRDPNTGIGYQVQVEVPTARMNSVREVGLVPIKRAGDRPGTSPSGQLYLQDVARIQEGVEPGEYDRYNMRRLVSMTANVQDEDLGRVAGHISRALANAGEPPRGVSVEVRGQIVPMQEMFGGLTGNVRFPSEAPWSNWSDWLRFAREFFAGLTGGLLLAVVSIFLLLTAYFQSLRLALVVVLTAPAVVAGVVLALLATGTTLNLQSFMGAIMAVGVAMANAILLVTFAERARREGARATDAAVDGARHRLRPILMTSCAMIAGMVPMAWGRGEGGEQTAPLGRAVIGGLLAATVTTLLVLPSLFAIVQGDVARAAGWLLDKLSVVMVLPSLRALVQGWARRLLSGRYRSPSLDPDDPESTYFDQAPNDSSENEVVTLEAIPDQPRPATD
jgi:multidrug efflux pump subunit AcrB